MNIIVGEENARHLDGRYLVLELDSFRVTGKSELIQSYALIDSLSFSDLFQVDEYRKLHQNLIQNYRSKNWESCRVAIEQLMGKWQGDLDSFYENLLERITDLKTSEVSDDWDGVIIKT
jgi:hypothetical protein